MKDSWEEDLVEGEYSKLENDSMLEGAQLSGGFEAENVGDLGRRLEEVNFAGQRGGRQFDREPTGTSVGMGGGRDLGRDYVYPQGDNYQTRQRTGGRGNSEGLGGDYRLMLRQTEKHLFLKAVPRLELFDGKEDWRDFNAQFLRHTAFREWNEAEATAMLAMHLKGEALHYFQHLPREVTLDLVRSMDAMSSRFAKQQTTECIRAKFRNAFQKELEHNEQRTEGIPPSLHGQECPEWERGEGTLPQVL